MPTATLVPLPTVQDQPTPTPAPSDNEPGISPDTIRIGVIIDAAGDPVSDQMAASAAEAVEAWANAVNTEGGLAGRDVVVQRILTSPLLADHATAIDLACNSDLFALVGSTALFDSEGLDQLQSPSCRLPDFPGFASSIERLDSSVTTVSNPINANIWSAGWARYYSANFPDDAIAAAAMQLELELPVSLIRGERMIEAANAHGYEFVYQSQIAFDTDFVVEVAELVEAEATMLTWRDDGGRLIDLLNELDNQEVRLNATDCGQACYSRVWVDAAGTVGDGTAVWLPTFPLEEADLKVELTRYLFWLGATSSTSGATSAGISAWASALLFEEAVNIAVGQGTSGYDPTGLTRTAVLDAAATITEWDARGLHGVSNPAAGIPSPCFMLMTLENGAWERTYPERRGELDCDTENLVALAITSSSDSAELPTPTPVPAPTPTPTPGQPDEEGLGDENSLD